MHSALSFCVLAVCALGLGWEAWEDLGRGPRGRSWGGWDGDLGGSFCDALILCGVSGVVNA